MIRLRRKINEEGAPANAAGGGNIAGLGVGAAGEPGVSVAAQRKHQRKNASDPQTPVMGDILRRNTLDTNLTEEGKFAGNTTHIVPSDVYHSARLAKKERKHWRTYLDKSDHAKKISEWAKKNPKKPVILQDERTGAMCYARYGRS